MSTTTARDRLRARHEQQLALLNTYVGFDALVVYLAAVVATATALFARRDVAG